MKKKALCILMASMMAFSMTACGGESNSDNKVTETPAATQAPSGENTTDTTPAPEANVDVDFDVHEIIQNIQEKADLGGMYEASVEEFVNMYGIDASAIEDASLLAPMMIVNASEFALVKAKTEADVAKVVEGINKRVAALDEQWSTYLPDQYELVENHTIVTKGRYVFLMIGENDVKAYAQNQFDRKFDPSIEEMVLLRKFYGADKAEVVEISATGMTVKMTENGKTYTFVGTFSDDVYCEEGLDTIKVGDVVNASFPDAIQEADTMNATINFVELFKLYEATAATVKEVTDNGLVIESTAADGTVYTFNCTIDEYFDATTLPKAVEVGDTIDAYFAAGVVPTEGTIDAVIGFMLFTE